jgi:hypothetical protein
VKACLGTSIAWPSRAAAASELSLSAVVADALRTYLDDTHGQQQRTSEEETWRDHRGHRGRVRGDHNWGKAARFFQALGFRLEFETDHASGQLRNGEGPYVFGAEVPADRRPQLQIVLKAPNADAGSWR